MKQLFTVSLAAFFLLNLAGCQQSDFASTITTTNSKVQETEVATSSATQVHTNSSTNQYSTKSTTKPTPSVSTSAISQSTLFREPKDTDFVRILDYIPTARVELPYATTDNFTGCQIYDFTDCYLRYGTLKKLVKVSNELSEQGIGLLIWDGFRPVAAQEKLWEICPDPAFVSHPITGKRSHCRGNTVDISLYDLNSGKDLPVPTGYDNFTAYADRDYSDCSKEAAQNARLLEQTMEKHGFTSYFAEWWHFADAQNYPVEEVFNPAISDTFQNE